MSKKEVTRLVRTSTEGGALFPHNQHKALEAKHFMLFTNNEQIPSDKFWFKVVTQDVIAVMFTDEAFFDMKIEMVIFDEESSEENNIFLQRQLKSNITELTRVFTDTKRLLKKIRFNQDKERHLKKREKAKNHGKQQAARGGGKSSGGEVQPRPSNPNSERHEVRGGA